MVGQLFNTFLSDPSLIAFAQLRCDPSWNDLMLVSIQFACKYQLSV
ncbi:unnamed protein product, partial [Vitis vinifera]|uniref:Uncharacterized protein n=1 Tax=Vitis vinifera TaxID=29760 RepID=D7SRI1_VITVI